MRGSVRRDFCKDVLATCVPGFLSDHQNAIVESFYNAALAALAPADQDTGNPVTSSIYIVHHQLGQFMTAETSGQTERYQLGMPNLISPADIEILMHITALALGEFNTKISDRTLEQLGDCRCLLPERPCAQALGDAGHQIPHNIGPSILESAAAMMLSRIT